MLPHICFHSDEPNAGAITPLFLQLKMEVRGQQEKDIGMPSSLGNYNPPNNRESPSKLSSASTIISTLPERRKDANSILNPSQTLDHDHLHHHHQFNLHNQKQIQGRDPNPDPDPAPAPAPIAVAGATNTIPIASGSISKSPLPVPVTSPTAPPSNSATTTTTAIRYRECLKNHAANMGGHAVDGCGEFMPTGDEGTLEALKCAACDCHRNFHRKEIDGEPKFNANCQYTCNNPNKNSSRRNTIIPPHHQFPPSSLIPPPPSSHLHHHHQTVAAGPAQPTMMMAFGGVPAESSSEDLNVFQSNVGVQPSSAHMPSYSRSKKRFRTKFSQEQKDKMLGFAEKLGWKIQKQDEEEVQQFCSQVGVRRQVFKVWMHNNKQAIKKKQ